MDGMAYQKTILPIIKEAGKIINYNYRYSRKIEKKGYANYVTDLDKRIESYIISEITRTVPESIFVSEEDSHFTLATSYWVLDPIDGTTNLLHGYKSVCISLAHVQCGEVDFGVVYCPNTNEMFYAETGKGAYLLKGKHTRKIQVDDNKSLKGSLIGFGCPYNKQKVPFLMKLLERILQKCDDIKRLGPASLDICYVACGRLSAYVELDLEIWDFLAGSLIIQEAGGKICDFSGEALKNKRTNLIASNPYIIDELLKITQKLMLLELR